MTPRREHRGVSLYKKTSSAEKWTLAWFDLRTGKRRTLTRFRDKRNAERTKVEMQRALEKGDVAYFDRLVGEGGHSGREAIVESFLVSLRANRRTEKHIKNTRTQLLRILEKMEVQALDEMTLGGALEALAGLTVQMGQDDSRNGQLVSAKTRDHYAALLKQFGEWAVDTDLLDSNPLRKLKPVRTAADKTFQRKALTSAELRHLVHAAEARPLQEYRRTHPHASDEKLEELERLGRDRGVLYLVVAITGMRHDEAGGLVWRNCKLHAEMPTITIPAADTKSRRERVAPLPRWLAKRLAAWKAQLAIEAGCPIAGSDAVFRVPKDIAKRLRMDAEWASISTDWKRARLDFHALRHTAITLLHASGVLPKDAQEIMGHADPSITLQTYTHTGHLHEAIDQVPDPMREVS